MEALLVTQRHDPVHQGYKSGLFIRRVVMCPRVQVKVCVGRFSVDFMAQGAIRSPINVNVQERKVAILLRFHGKLNIPVKAIQMFNVGKQLPHDAV